MTDQELKDLVARLAVSNEFFDQQHKEINMVLKNIADRQEKAERRQEKADQREDKIDRRLNKIAKLVGGVSNNNGYYTETFFQDVFEEEPEFGGVKYDTMVANFGRRDEKVKMEIDIVLINCDSVALIEAKYRIHPNDVTELATERVKKFRALYPEYDRYKVYLGVAGFSFDEAVLAKAKEYGVGIVKPAGEEAVELETECLTAY